jgi:hypothetical protein
MGSTHKPGALIAWERSLQCLTIAEMFASGTKQIAQDSSKLSCLNESRVCFH